MADLELRLDAVYLTSSSRISPSGRTVSPVPTPRSASTSESRTRSSPDPDPSPSPRWVPLLSLPVSLPVLALSDYRSPILVRPVRKGDIRVRGARWIRMVSRILMLSLSLSLPTYPSVRVCSTRYHPCSPSNRSTCIGSTNSPAPSRPASPSHS